MIRFSRKIWFVFFILLSLYCTDLAILFHVPFAQPVLGFLFLTVVPGFLVLETIGFSRHELTEKIVLSIGLSIALILIIGLFQNFFFQVIGVQRPLSQINTVLTISTITLLLVLVWYIRNKDGITVFASFHLHSIEKCLLTISLLCPIISILGVYLLNNNNQNTLLLLLFILIPLTIGLVGIFRTHISPKVLVIILFIIGLSIILILPMRSEYLIGSDTHNEFYFFIRTLTSGLWEIRDNSILEGCISVTILPVIYWNYTGINPESLFKFLYPLLTLIVPPVIFFVVRKYLNNWDAFLAACIYMLTTYFVNTASDARATIALIFIALMVWMIFSSNIEFKPNILLFSIFCFACVSSYYASPIFFFLILLCLFVVLLLICPHSSKNPLHFTHIFIFSAIIFFWYALIISYLFKLQINLIYYGEQTTISQLPQNTPILVADRVLSIIGSLSDLFVYFILIGAIILVLILIKFSIFGHQDFQGRLLKERIDMPFSVMLLICCILLFVAKYFTYVFSGWGFIRIYSIIYLVLPVLFILGIKGTMEICLESGTLIQKKILHARFSYINKLMNFLVNWKLIFISIIILIIVVSNFLMITLVSYQISGRPQSFLINTPPSSPPPLYDMNSEVYIHSQETAAGQWVNTFLSDLTGKIFFDKLGGAKMLSRTHSEIIEKFVDSPNTIYLIDYNYYYLCYSNVNYQKFYFGKRYDIKQYEFSRSLNYQHLIYSNGGSQFFMQA